MIFALSSQNVFDYLVTHQICQLEEQPSSIEIKFAKNFNLLLQLKNGCQLLVKQERHTLDGKTAGEFLNEWRTQELLRKFSEFEGIKSSFPEVLYFNAIDSIIVFNYLADYRDLNDFHIKTNIFPAEVATLIGGILAEVHRTTINHRKYQEFLVEQLNGEANLQVSDFTRGLERVEPEIFGLVPADALKFFALYQRYDSLGQALTELSGAFTPCCLTHNDLKLNNILLHNDWEQFLGSAEPARAGIIRIIDWERSGWGDPAYDLGTIIASYLQIWLSSLVISQSLDIQAALRLAIVPLEYLQPSITALIKAYFSKFPEILEHRPDFLKRTIQFSGLALIQQIQAMIQYQKSFGNAGIFMLQVAKSLLCRPEQSISTVFGMTELELINLSYSQV
ncbi:MAG: aminoglycoside phosphotransferase family protein [Nodularia sp. (in: Bacteria)]|nr:MAG: aminoglycoside phosphotransferase family protein [Nodularia sp. (in: cyanobacteria)]